MLLKKTDINRQSESTDLPKSRLEWILRDAMDAHASDIHLSPYNKHTVHIRYRIDGSLYMRGEMTAGAYRELCYLIKGLAGIRKGDISPASKRLKINMGDQDHHFRIETGYNHIYGAAIITIRHIPMDSVFLDVDKIGFELSDLFALKMALHKKMGMILVSGPTGCGKTTTLYAAISYLHRLDMTEKAIDKHIVTIESPIDIPISGITQLEARDDVTVEDLVKSAMRHDPDIIMIGEIRDKASAQETLKASQTGHLVMTTVHANSALTAITKMINYDLDTYSFVTSTRAVLSQRLIQKLCPHCREKTTPDEIELRVLKNTGETLPATYYKKGKGCAYCGGNGLEGRKLIYEFFPIDSEDQGLILGKLDEKISLDRLRGEFSRKHNTNTLPQNIIRAISQGEISVKEAITHL
ncbi:MAG: ATPase, T2SS/T4P/T4SS family [Pseudomonadota bacterium]